jgi:hypothetical protein
LLQDRFCALVVTNPASRTNPQRGELLESMFDHGDPDVTANVSSAITIVVEALDRAAFDPAWSDDDPLSRADYERAATALGIVERELGRIGRDARQLTCS